MSMKAFALVLLWVAASLGAVSVAWAGVNVVNSEVISPPTVTLAVPALIASATNAEAAVDNNEPDETTDAGDGSGAPAATTSSATVPSTSLAHADESGTVAAVDPAGGEDPGANQQDSTSQTSPPTSVAPPTEAPVSPTTTVAPAETATFLLQGGSAAVSFSSAEVLVLWATAHPGYDVTIEPESPGWKVEFRSDTHRSRLDIWWSGGPMHEIKERAS